MNQYIGHESQLYGVEEVRLVGGKGDGMRLLNVKNGQGLEFTVSADRCADISRLSFKSVNFGYFSPCGYVAPAYYDSVGAGFLKSFTAGFLTTCGLTAVGSPCTDAGEETPLHGTIGNTPAELVNYWTDDKAIHIIARIRDAQIFGRQLLLDREFYIPLDKNELTITDTVTNIGAGEVPLQMLYHFNVGYPLLDENTVLTIPSTEVTPRNDHAAEDIANWMNMEKPQADYEERCYFHKMQGNTEVKVYNPNLKKGLVMCYDADILKYFTEWKMMGVHDYVLGVEPGNTLPDGRDVMRAKGLLETLSAGAKKTHSVTFKFTEEA